jgi:5'-methylthioadenosine phosphorylase
MKSTPRVAIIGGTGAEELEPGAGIRARTVATPYGPVEVQEADRVLFLPRHGAAYVAPHNIDARANISALVQEGVGHVLATAACGSMDESLAPGDLAVLTDFVDFTRNRICTFDPQGPPVYTDMSQPYDPHLRSLILETATRQGTDVHAEAVYACTEGPRFETRAEIRAYRLLGCRLVGMTQVPEVVLAREAGLSYAALAIVTNYAAGMQSAISEEEVRTMMAARGRTVLSILMEVARLLSPA